MKTLFGFILGVVAGATAALLFAPTSGEELREKVRTEADTNMEKINTQWQKGMQDIKVRLDQTQVDLKTALEKAPSEGTPASE